MGLFPTKLGSTGSGASNVITAAEFEVLEGLAATGSSAAQLDPAVAGKRFNVLSIMMRANGGNVSGPTTVGVKEDGGAIFLSHVIADLTAAVWHDLATGTAVKTGITSGGTTAVANKGMLVYCAGGDTTFATATSLDTIVVGYYTTI